MGDVPRILSAIDQGDPAAAEQLLPLVYDELHRLAAKDWRGSRRGTRSSQRPSFTRRSSAW